MKSIIVQLDEATYKALGHIAPASRRKQSQFVRDAIRRAIREAEYARIRAAYREQPDAESEADDWSTAEDYEP